MRSEFDEDRQFWDELGAGRFSLQRCEQCGEHHFPPGPACWRCGATRFAWEPLPAETFGIVYSWTTLHKSYMKFAEMAPYTVTVAELVSHPRVRILARLLDGRPPLPAIGDKLLLRWGMDDDGQPYYGWTRAVP